jgi:hypothetical protein
MQNRSQGAHDSGPPAHHGPGLGANDEVSVALPNPRFLGQLAVRDGQWPDRLGCHRPPIDHHGEFTSARSRDLSVNENVVTEIDRRLPAGQLVGADQSQAQHGLQLRAVALLQGGEAELAGVPEEDHTPGDADHLAGVGVRRKIGMGRAHLAQGVRPLDGDRVGVVALRVHLGPLRPPHPDLFGEFVVGVLGRLVAHQGKASGSGR